MPRDLLQNLADSKKALRRALRRNREVRDFPARDLSNAVRDAAYDGSTPFLLQMAEGLIHAHQAAQVDNDDDTLDLIEDALLHVGRRLSNEPSSRQGSASGRRLE